MPTRPWLVAASWHEHVQMAAWVSRSPTEIQHTYFQVAGQPAAVDAVSAGHDGVGKLLVQALTLCIREKLLMCLHLQVACMSLAA